MIILTIFIMLLLIILALVLVVLLREGHLVVLLLLRRRLLIKRGWNLSLAAAPAPYRQMIHINYRRPCPSSCLIVGVILILMRWFLNGRIFSRLLPV